MISLSKLSILRFLRTDGHRVLITRDYNGIIYKLERKEQALRFSFTCYNFKQIFALTDQYLISTYYKGINTTHNTVDYTVEPDPEVGFDITLVFDCSVIREL